MSGPSAHRPLLWPLVPAYRLALALRELQLRAGLKKVWRLHWPVVSVGNLSAGGAGKTPLTIALAQALAARGLHVDVLSRGYGRTSPLVARVDPNGSAEQFGDEPLVIAQQAGVSVFVAPDRYSSGTKAELDSAPRTGVHLLDDGFQHRQLARDIDILLLSRRDLRDCLLPAGNLREPLHAVRRAQVIAIPADEPDVEASLRSRGWQGVIWRIHRHMDLPPLSGPVAAFCGIARPEQFFDGLEQASLQLAARAAFPDHHRYIAADLDRLLSQARAANASALITTEKDRLRLGPLAGQLSQSLPLHTVQLRIEIEDKTAVLDALIDRLNR